MDAPALAEVGDGDLPDDIIFDVGSDFLKLAVFKGDEFAIVDGEIEPGILLIDNSDFVVWCSHAMFLSPRLEYGLE